MYKRVCTSSNSAKRLSVQCENKYHDLSQKVTQYVQELHILRRTYKRMNINNKSVNCANI